MEGITVKASIVAMSHLSDAQESMNCNCMSKEEVNIHINFSKFIINKTNGNLNQEIDADKYWDEYCKKYNVVYPK